jgi:type II secretory pathway predicted ATPase ExeA
VIDKLQGFYGFTRMPFGRDLAPGMLHRSTAHNEAVARIGWCVTEHRIGVITGEVGAGKTVAIRAALSTLDASRHSIIYLPNPTIGVRGIHHQIVAALGGHPWSITPPWSRKPPPHWPSSKPSGAEHPSW